MHVHDWLPFGSERVHKVEEDADDLWQKIPHSLLSYENHDHVYDENNNAISKAS